VLNGGFITFAGTACALRLAADDLLAADGSIEANARAVSADADIIRTGGDIIIYAYGNMESAWNADGNDTAEGGTLDIIRAPWKFCHTDFANDMTVWTSFVAPNRHECAIGAFINGTCAGIADDGYLRAYSNETSGTLSFRAYDYETQREYRLMPSLPVSFSPNAVAGSGDAPLTLSIATMIGDVNADGLISIADVTALVNIILGKDDKMPYTYDHNAADTNEDGLVNIADVTKLVNIILGR
jgi:hypothetical protein